MNKTIKTGICIFLSILLFCGAIGSFAFAVSEEELNLLKDNAQEALETANYHVNMTVNTIDEINSEIFWADQAIGKIDEEIAGIDAEIAQLNTQMVETQKRLDQAEKQRKEKEKELEERIRSMYMFGTDGYLQVLFSATSFGDLLERIDVVSSLMSADMKMLHELEAAKAKVEQEKVTLQKQQAQADAKRKAQEVKRADQASIREQLEALRAQNEGLLADYEREAAEQEAQLHEIEAQLAEIAAEKQRQLEAELAAQQVSSSGFIWPSDSRTISSYFGPREAPTEGASTYHEGLDIAANLGSNVYAVADGKVTLAEYYGGYGNCVMIAHSNGITTLYGHNDSLNVTDGQWVKQGDVIAFCGSTGISTGPHIHFSVITSDGEYVDPMGYLP